MDSKTILQKMTLKEKIALCSGQDFWHTKAMKQYGIEALMDCANRRERRTCLAYIIPERRPAFRQQ